eukprot:COSAG01_NODE_1918_length_8905_cov_2.532591_5_plen_129_part_00
MGNAGLHDLLRDPPAALPDRTRDDRVVRRPLRPATCCFDWDFPMRRLFLSRNIEGATDAGSVHILEALNDLRTRGVGSGLVRSQLMQQLTWPDNISGARMCDGLLRSPYISLSIDVEARLSIARCCRA